MSTMEKFDKTLAIVTGCSGGIGSDICSVLANSNSKIQVIGLDIISPKYQITNFKFYKCDITNITDLISVFNAIKNDFPNLKPQILINNAGVCRETPILCHQGLKSPVLVEPCLSPTKAFENISLQVNVLVTANIMLTRMVTEIMDHQKPAHVINIGSTAAHGCINVSYCHVYSACKNAVRIISDGLRNDLKEVGSKAKVTLISPGAVRTELGKTINNAVAGFMDILGMDVKNVSDQVMNVLKMEADIEVKEIIIENRKGLGQTK